MTDRYLWHSSAQDDSDAEYNSSTVAYTTLSALFSAMAVGDSVNIAKEHIETFGGNTTLVFIEGQYIVKDRTTGLAAKMEDSTGKIKTNTGYDLIIDGQAGLEGIFFECGDSFRWQSDRGHDRGLRGKGCRVDFTSGDAEFLNAQEGYTLFTDGKINFLGGASDQSSFYNQVGGYLGIKRTIITGMDGASGITKGNSYGAIDFEDCSFPDVDSGSALTQGNTSGLVRFSGSSFAVPQPSHDSGDWGYGGRVEAIACTDETSDNVTMCQAADDLGQHTPDTSVYLDADMENSWEFIDNNCQRANPFVSIPISAYIDSTGSKTFTVELILVHATVPPTGLTDQELGLSLTYYDNASNAYRVRADASAVPGSTPTTLTTSTETWLGAYLSGKSVTKQKITITVTVNRVGYAEAVIELYEPLAASTELFINPVLGVS